MAVNYIILKILNFEQILIKNCLNSLVLNNCTILINLLLCTLQY